MTNDPVSELDHLKADLAFMIRERDAAVERADELSRQLRVAVRYNREVQDDLWERLQRAERALAVDGLAGQFEHAARDVLSATVNLMSTTLGVPVLDVDDLLDDVDWRQVARNHLGVSS